MDNEQNTAEETTEIKEEPVKILKDNLLTEKQKKMQKALRWILITVGSLMMALSVYFFQTPNGITLGGVADRKSVV